MVRWRYLTLPGGVLAIWPHQNLKYHFSGTDSWIKLRPICKYMIWSKYSTKSKGSYPILAPTKILLEKMTLPWQPMTPTFCYKIFFFYKSMGGKTDFNIFIFGPLQHFLVKKLELFIFFRKMDDQTKTRLFFRIFLFLIF